MANAVERDVSVEEAAQVLNARDVETLPIEGGHGDVSGFLDEREVLYREPVRPPRVSDCATTDAQVESPGVWSCERHETTLVGRGAGLEEGDHGHAAAACVAANRITVDLDARKTAVVEARVRVTLHVEHERVGLPRRQLEGDLRVRILPAAIAIDGDLPIATQ